MELFEAINKRRTVRNFKNEPVEAEKLEKILDAAVQAPSAGNLQAWEFVLVKEKERKEGLASASYGQDFIKEAPIVIIVCANKKRSGSKYGERGRSLYCIQDCALATENMLLAVCSLGLGAGFVGAFDEEKVRTVLNLPKGVRPLSIHPIGYPDEEFVSHNRFSLNKVIHFEKF